ncbi:MAG: hypothetical protein M2R45_00824 [Verrucomicrobia subdivision 3 bacterium]|nr:hypothetical protein [Limisphaerales bacterium]MCS1413070.1 hypothetical protein [Limisphaerales bacterium]
MIVGVMVFWRSVRFELPGRGRFHLAGAAGVISGSASVWSAMSGPFAVCMTAEKRAHEERDGIWFLDRGLAEGLIVTAGFLREAGGFSFAPARGLAFQSGSLMGERRKRRDRRRVIVWRVADFNWESTAR